MVAGGLTLCGLFLAILPLVAWRVALAVQLQTSRVFWMLDLAVTVYVVWLLVDSPFWRRWGVTLATARRAVVTVLAIVSIVRGGYIMWVERPERSLFQVGVVQDEWGDVMTWAARERPGVHLLTDPGHAWRYGTSVRVAGRRDVYLEEVKDTAIAMYSPEVARRVAERQRDLGSLDGLTPDAARALARKYSLDYLVAEQSFDLPVVYRNTRFRVYDLR